MNKLVVLILSIIFIAPVIVGETSIVNRAYAACDTAAYCDAPPGSCSSTCNGGDTCIVGGRHNEGRCSSCNSGLGCQNIGGSCALPDEPYTATCQLCEQCIDVIWTSCCTPGTPPPTGSPVPSPSASPTAPPPSPTPPPIDNPTPSPSPGGPSPTPPGTPPNQPTNLSCLSPNDSQIVLNWNSTASATSYNIFRCSGTSCTPTTPAIGSTSTISYVNSGLTAGTTYRYRITASNAAGSSPYSSIVTCSPCETGSWEAFSCGAPFCDTDERVESRTTTGSCSLDIETERCVQDDLCLAESWFQVQGGNTYADRTESPAIRSIISASDCTEPECIPNLITMMQELLNIDTDGVIISGGGSVETAGHYTPRDLVAQNTRLTRFKEGYDFFYRRSDLGSSPTDTFATQHDGALKPTLDGVHYSSQDLVIQDPWTVSAGESHVVFVDGNLTIENPSDFATLIEVEEGGFLAFIARGNVTFAANVGHTNVATVTPNVEGVFIADNQIIVRTNDDPAVGDRRFVGAGSFVGWTGVDLQRDFADFGAGGSGATFNLTIPTETFIYRPDLVLSTPDFMLSPRSIWQETN